MPRFNHMLDLTFDVVSEKEDGSDITLALIQSEINQAISLFDASKTDGFTIGGVFNFCDTYKIEEFL